MCVGSTGNVGGDDVNITHGLNPSWMRTMMMECHSRDVRKISLGQQSRSFTPVLCATLGSYMCTLWSATNLKSCKALSLFTSQWGNQRAQQEKHKHPSPSPRLCFLADMQLRNVNTVVNQCTHTTSYFSMLLLTTTAEPVNATPTKGKEKWKSSCTQISSGQTGFIQWTRRI